MTAKENYLQVLNDIAEFAVSAQIRELQYIMATHLCACNSDFRKARRRLAQHKRRISEEQYQEMRDNIQWHEDIYNLCAKRVVELGGVARASLY